MPNPFNRRWRICERCGDDRPHDGGNRLCIDCVSAIAKELKSKLAPQTRLRVRRVEASELLRETKGVE